MKRIIALLAFFLLFSANTCQHTIEEVEDRIMVSYDDTLNVRQLDSLFVAEKISSDVENDWISSSAISEDKSEMLYKYVYIKELTDSTGVLFTLYAYDDSLFIINKRVMQ